MYLGLDTRYEDVDDVLANLLEHTLVVRVKLIVLRRDDNGIDTLGDTLVAVLNGHLTLGIRAQVGHHLAFLADVGQRTHDEVCQVQRHGHQALGLVGGISEHHTLVAGTLLVLVAIVHAAVDVLALLVDGGQYAA